MSLWSVFSIVLIVLGLPSRFQTAMPMKQVNLTQIFVILTYLVSVAMRKFCFSSIHLRSAKWQRSIDSRGTLKAQVRSIFPNEMNLNLHTVN